MRGSGDGWTRCDRGHRHWGRFGAAGLLLRSVTPGRHEVLLQRRSAWSHHGDTWGIPGGARDDDETAVAAALREVREETTLDPARVQVEATFRDDHGGWSYTTVIGWSGRDPEPAPSGPESTDLRWVPDLETGRLELHPGFGITWPTLRPVGRSPLLLVDAANTMGSRPDGWWRDRAGAATRLRDELAAVDGWPDDPIADWLGREPVRSLTRFCPVVLVVEGAARSVAGLPGVPGVDVVAAPGSGDDTIVDRAAPATARRPVLVVTADRELRARVRATGAVPVGPRALLAELARTAPRST